MSTDDCLRWWTQALLRWLEVWVEWVALVAGVPEAPPLSGRTLLDLDALWSLNGKQRQAGQRPAA